MKYWLVKTEPDTYSWGHLLAQKEGMWDGVRNFAARNHLKSMNKGDLALFYHTGKEKAVVGVVKVTKEAFPDPTAKEPGWVAVKVKPVQKLKRPVTLEEIKHDAVLENMIIVKRGRLSVSSVTEKEYERVIKLGSK